MKYLKRFNESINNGIEDIKDVLINLIDLDYGVYIDLDESLEINEQSSINVDISKVLDIEFSNYNAIHKSVRSYTKELFHRHYFGRYEEEIKIDNYSNIGILTSLEDFLPEVTKTITNRPSYEMKESEKEVYDLVISDLVRLYKFLYNEFKDNFEGEINEYIVAFIDFKITEIDNKTKVNFYFAYLNYNLSDLD
jgi:hypothetical protein